jgi:hypothetical protein
MRRGLLSVVVVMFLAQCGTAEAGFAPENDLIGTGPFRKPRRSRPIPRAIR